MIRDRAVAHRYSAALFGAAVKLGCEDAILADLQSLEDLARHDRSFQRFLETPDVPAERKVEAIGRLLQGRVDDLLIRFLLLMLKKGRLPHLPLVLPQYRQLLEDHRGLVRARVVTAVPLAADLAEQLRARLEKLNGRPTTCELQVDPMIIGGVIVMLGGKIIDASIRYQLSLLREQLRGARVQGSGGI